MTDEFIEEPLAPDDESGVLPRPRWTMLTVVAAAAYAPLSLYATQGDLLARGYRLIGFVLAAALLLTPAAALLSLLPVRAAAAWFAVSVVWIVITAGAPLVAELGPGLTVGLLILLVILVLALNRSRFLNALMVAVTAYLILAPLTIMIGGQPRVVADPVAVGAEDAQGVGRPSTTPDIWYLVLDGYPSAVSLVDDFGDPETSLAEGLEQLGFSVQPNALVPYSRTVGALSSVLAGRMVVPAGSTMDTADMLAAAAIMGGDSTLVEDLGGVGYHTTMIEAGWHLSRCGEQVETCVKSGLIDDMASALVSGSIVPTLFGVDPDIGTLMATRRTFHELDRLRTQLGDNGRPDLVVAHSLAPHPPMLLDAQCRSRPPSPATSGRVLAVPELGRQLIAERAAAFVDQVTCVDSMVERFVRDLPSGDVVVILGDHGSEILGQASALPSEWTDEMLRERLLTLAAIRVPGCDSTIRATIELVGALLDCMGLDPPSRAPLTSRIIPNIRRPDGSNHPVYEIPSQRLERLLAEAGRDS